MRRRRETQPVSEKTAGSTFLNPAPKSAWKLIDEAGCRGMVHRGAQVSELHTNFLINYQNATAKDLEELAELVRHRVFQHAAVNLEWEVICWGFYSEA